MNRIFVYKGYYGLYKVFSECIVVSVYYNHNRLFGFSVSKNVSRIEREFMLNVECYIKNRSRISEDLKTRRNILIEAQNT